MEPILVMVVGEDAELRASVRALVRFMEHVTVVDMVSGAAALSVVKGLYEQPRGCPDVVILASDATDVDSTAAEFAQACPGVRLVRVVDASVQQERRIVAAIAEALVTVR